MKYSNQYMQKRYEDKKALAKELTEKTGIKFIFVDTQEADEREYVKLADSAMHLEASYNDYSKKYSFYLKNRLLYINSYGFSDIVKKFTRPNEVGVLTTKKVQAWIDYNRQIDEEQKIQSAKKQHAVSEFLREFKQAGGIARQKVHDWENANTTGTWDGRLEKNGVLFEFSIDDSGYISKKLSLHYSVNHNLANFKALANNQYKGENE